MVWKEVKTFGNVSLFLENVFHQVGFIVRITEVTFEMMLELFGYQ